MNFKKLAIACLISLACLGVVACEETEDPQAPVNPAGEEYHEPYQAPPGQFQPPERGTPEGRCSAPSQPGNPCYNPDGSPRNPSNRERLENGRRDG